MSKAKTWLVLGLILGFGAADAFFKVWAINYFDNQETSPANLILALALHKNPGIAFDIPIPLSVVVPLSLVASAVFAWTAYKHWFTRPPLAFSALTVVVGALGNMIDRLVNNFTTDYLILFQTSAINLSDVLILLGILGTLWYGQSIPDQPSPTAGHR